MYYIIELDIKGNYISHGCMSDIGDFGESIVSEVKYTGYCHFYGRSYIMDSNFDFNDRAEYNILVRHMWKAMIDDRNKKINELL